MTSGFGGEEIGLKGDRMAQMGPTFKVKRVSGKGPQGPIAMLSRVPTLREMPEKNIAIPGPGRGLIALSGPVPQQRACPEWPLQVP
jgi:hypothetical protein